MLFVYIYKTYPCDILHVDVIFDLIFLFAEIYSKLVNYSKKTRLICYCRHKLYFVPFSEQGKTNPYSQLVKWSNGNFKLSKKLQ